MFAIKGLKVQVDNNEILHGVDLKVEQGKVHALMGKNGSGKSTLAQTLMGHPLYVVTGGTAKFENIDILKKPSDERAKLGLFLSFQYPAEVAGVNISNYLRMIYNKKAETKLSPMKFREFIKEKMEVLHMKPEILERYLNEGFSGGEKKRMEMLQMLVLQPKVAILDEVDSGLDIDAIKIVAAAVEYLRKTSNTAILIITHYTRILKYITPEVVSIMDNGKIIRTGDESLANELEEKGYAIIA